MTAAPAAADNLPAEILDFRASRANIVRLVICAVVATGGAVALLLVGLDLWDGGQSMPAAGAFGAVAVALIGAGVCVRQVFAVSGLHAVLDVAGIVVTVSGRSRNCRWTEIRAVKPGSERLRIETGPDLWFDIRAGLHPWPRFVEEVQRRTAAPHWQRFSGGVASGLAVQFEHVSSFPVISLDRQGFHIQFGRYDDQRTVSWDRVVLRDSHLVLTVQEKGQSRPVATIRAEEVANFHILRVLLRWFSQGSAEGKGVPPLPVTIPAL